MLTEREYLEKRKEQANELSGLFKENQDRPIKRNKIVFSSYEGDGGFCCNPRYIAEELHRRSSEYEMVWLTHCKSGGFPEYIREVEDTPENAARHLSDAKIWVDNYRKPYGTLKRDGQYYLQTWHASFGFKAVGLYRGDAFPKIARIVSEYDSSLIDCVISNSAYCDAVYPKKLLYSGKTIRSGTPREDPLIRDKEHLYGEIRRRYCLEAEARIFLYAPTFRGGTQKGEKQVVSETPSLDFEKVIENLERSCGGKWYAFLRLHPQLAVKMDLMPICKSSDRVVDVSREPDMSRLLGGIDLLLTDYSSCAFDAAFAGIPVLLYADDAKEYEANRGSFMWEKEALPFMIAQLEEELFENIERFDVLQYQKKVSVFMEKHEVIEDGKASRRVADLIEQWMG